MYSSNRIHPGRGRVVAFEARNPSEDKQDESNFSVPSPDEPEAPVRMDSEETDFRQDSVISSERPLFRLFNMDIWLDDVIILAVILFLIMEKRYDGILLPVLVFLFLTGFGLFSDLPLNFT